MPSFRLHSTNTQPTSINHSPTDQHKTITLKPNADQPTARLWRRVSLILLALTMVILSGCLAQEKRDQRDDILRTFEAQLRFGNNFEALLNFIHPDFLKEHPISSVEMRRLNLYRVSGYRTRSVVVSDDEKSLNQVVELSLYSQSTARERTILYPQTWILDEERNRWMLHSGLPNIDDN